MYPGICILGFLMHLRGASQGQGEVHALTYILLTGVEKATMTMAHKTVSPLHTTLRFCALSIALGTNQNSQDAARKVRNPLHAVLAAWSCPAR